MDFDLTEEQQLLKTTVREYLEKEIAPQVNDYERKGPLTRPDAIAFIKQLMPFGFYNGRLDEDCGGSNLDAKTYGVINEELARVWAGLCGMISIAGSMPAGVGDSEKAEYQARLRAGESIGCGAISEPEVGSGSSYIATTAVADGDHWVVNGTKTWISCGPIADHMNLMVTVEPGSGRHGVRSLHLRKEVSPWEVVRHNNLLGVRAWPNGELRFDDVRVPRVNIREMRNAAEEATASRVWNFQQPRTLLAIMWTKREIQAFALATSSILSPVYTAEDLLADPHLAAREYFREIGGRKHPGAFVRAANASIGPWSSAPRLGEHQALIEALGRVSVPPVRPTTARGDAFTGLKVADFSWVGVGPMITKALADHGATVVRVESETHPDVLRLVGPFKDSRPGINRSQFWAYVNTSKHGLAFNMATDEGRAVAHRLVDWADVVVESFTPGTMAKWGFGYDELSKDRPDLVMLSTCLRGQTGPEAAFSGFGGQGAALSGIHSLTGWPDRPPSGPWGAYTDFINPRFGVAALGAVLLRRARTSQGEYLDLAQTEGGIRFIEPEILDYTVNGHASLPLGARSIYACPSGVFVSADGRALAISIETPQQWTNLVEALALRDLADPTMEQTEARRAHERGIETAVAEWCSLRNAFEAAHSLRERGVPAAAVAWPSDLYADPQLVHRGFFVTLDHQEMGPTPYDGIVTRFSGTPPELRAAHTLGQHTQQVLEKLMGYSGDEIVELAAAGALS